MTEPGGLPAQAGSPRSERSFHVRLLARQLTTVALDFLFPPRCIKCKRVGSLLCSSCLAQINTVPPIHEANSPLSERRATAVFGDAIQSAIHALKYEGKTAFADILGGRLADELKRSDWQPTLITAAPLGAQRIRERGYNQSGLLAEQLSARCGLPYQPDALRRIRETRPQVGLNRQERQSNVAGAFQADPTVVSGQRVVIIDDVYTTGATLRACASALLEAGANKIWALTVASAGAVPNDSLERIQQ